MDASVLSRIIETSIRSRLRTHGAVLVEGPKAVGKTTTAKGFAASAVRLDQDVAARRAAEVDPTLVLEGPTPRLIDEYQLVPGVWNAVRGRIDDLGAKGLFLLTGSATPDDEPTTHTGARRIAPVRMRTLSFYERGRSSGALSIGALLDGGSPSSDTARMPFRDVIADIAVGGWPDNLTLGLGDALDANIDYLDVITSVDVQRVDGVRRDPTAMRRLVRGFARNVATDASLRAVANSVDHDPAPNTLYDHVHALTRLYLVEDQEAWSPRLRSRVRLAATPKRHLADPSLAVAALGATPERLLGAEIGWTGFLFESQVVHDLRVLAQPHRAEVRFYRDNKGLEVDAVVERRDGRWLGIEVKLGPSRIDEGAANLLAMLRKLDASVQNLCGGLVVVSADTPTYVRDDAVVVTSLASLGP